MMTRKTPASLLVSLSALTFALLPAVGCSDDADPMGDGMDETSGDGDGDPTTGDGDPTTGDGDGDPTTGDGDGDPTTGDGDGDGDPTTGDGDGDVEDTTPPTVTMTSPSLDETGVMPDAVIEITFSEPMDKASVQAAWQSPDLPSNTVTFDWNAEGTVMTVTPNDPLMIADIEALEDPGQSYAFSLNSAATDLAGNSLDPELDVSFTTARRWATSIDRDAALTHFVYSNGVVPVNGSLLRVGDTMDNRGMRSFVSYAFADLPADMIALESATIHMLGWSTDGAPVSVMNGLGELGVHDVEYGEVSSVIYNVELGEYAGMLLAPIVLDEQGSVDVSALVLADLDAGQTHTQFRLAMTQATNNNGIPDYVEIVELQMPLEVTVLVP